MMKASHMTHELLHGLKITQVMMGYIICHKTGLVSMTNHHVTPHHKTTTVLITQTATQARRNAFDVTSAHML